LEHLRTAQPTVFGGDDHRFRLNAPLSEDRIEAFELDHAIKIPTEFREFLTGIGNGGAGPFGGIFPLGTVDDNFDLRSWQVNDWLVGKPCAPFVFETAWNDISGMPPVETVGQNDYFDRLGQFEERYWSSSLVNGAMPIAHEGCAIRVLLVVTGKQAGKLWEDRRSEYAGLMPVRLSDGSPATFNAWYNEWLAACLAAASKVCFADMTPGT
jgi:hypothetical protein